MQRNKTKYEVVNESAAKAVLGLSCKLRGCPSALTLTSAPSAFLSLPQPVTRADCLLTLKQLRRQTHTLPGASEPSARTLRECSPSLPLLPRAKKVCVCGGVSPHQVQSNVGVQLRHAPNQLPGMCRGYERAVSAHSSMQESPPSSQTRSAQLRSDAQTVSGQVRGFLLVSGGNRFQYSLRAQMRPRIRSGSNGELPEPTTAQCTESWRRRSAPRSRR